MASSLAILANEKSLSQASPILTSDCVKGVSEAACDPESYCSHFDESAESRLDSQCNKVNCCIVGLRMHVAVSVHIHVLLSLLVIVSCLSLTTTFNISYR